MREPATYAMGIFLALIPVCSQADVLISLDALTQISGTDFSLHYGGGIANANNVTFSGSPAITNGQVAGTTTYSAPSVFVAASKSAFTGSFGVGNSGGSGWRIRLNGNVADGNRFYSDNLFSVTNVTFDATNDTLNASTVFLSDVAAVSTAQVRFVIRAGGAFYISEASPNFQTGALDGGLGTNYSIEALSANWFNYDPTTHPATNGVADIGSAATPVFSMIDFIGFHLEATTASNGTIAAHNGCNFGVRAFSATGVESAGGVLPLEFWTFDSDSAGESFDNGSGGIFNSGTSGSVWNFGPVAGMTADGAGSFVVSNRNGSAFRQLPKAGTGIADPSLNQFAAPYTTGVYRLEVDYASWDLDPAQLLAGTQAFEARTGDGGTLVASIRLKVEDPTTARLQFTSTLASGQDFSNVAYSLAESNGPSAAIQFDFDNDTIDYFVDGSNVASFADFDGAQLGTLRFYTDANWTSNSVAVINELGLSSVEEIVVPVLAVDFDGMQITNSVHYENGTPLPLDMNTPAAGLPDYLGQPIYAGFEPMPINASTNSAALSFSRHLNETTSHGGVRLQWNGTPGGDDTGLYEEDDLSTAVALFKKEDFLNGLDAGTVFMDADNDTLNAGVHFRPRDPARLKSASFRWVVLDDGQYYASTSTTFTVDEGEIPITAEGTELSWFAYDPATSVATISNAATPTLQNIQAIGFWMQATVATNDGVRQFPGFRVNSFSAQAATMVFDYDAWAADFGLVGSEGDDDDLDGLDNLYEYGVGGNPTNALDQGNASAIATADNMGSNGVVFVHARRIGSEGELTYIVETDDDLVLAPGFTNAGFTVGAQTGVIDAEFEAVTNHIDTANTEAFIRLKIERQTP